MLEKGIESLEDFIESCINGLKGDLQTLLKNKPFHYDVLCEEFIKTFEITKMRILKELRNITHDPNSSKDSFKGSPNSKKERILLHQMKNLLTNKIRLCIDQANQEKNPLKKQELLDNILTLNESLQKIENNILTIESTLASGLKVFEHCIDSFRTDRDDSRIFASDTKLLLLQSSDKRPPLCVTRDLINITPSAFKPQRSPHGSNIPRSLAPNIPHSARNIQNLAFKSSNAISDIEESKVIQPLEKNPKIDKNIQNSTTSKILCEKKSTPKNDVIISAQLALDKNLSSGDGFGGSNCSGSTLFEMFDACLNNITKPISSDNNTSKQEKQEISAIKSNEKLNLIKKIIVRFAFKKLKTYSIRKNGSVKIKNDNNNNNNAKLKENSPNRITNHSLTPKKTPTMIKSIIICSSEKKVMMQLDDRLLKHRLEMLTIDGEEDLLKDENPNFTMIFNKEDLKESNLLLNSNMSFFEKSILDDNDRDDIENISEMIPKLDNLKINPKQKPEISKLKIQNNHEIKKEFENKRSNNNLTENKANTILSTSKRSSSKWRDKNETKAMKITNNKSTTARGNSVHKINTPTNSIGANLKNLMKINKTINTPSNKENVNFVNKSSPMKFTKTKK